MIINMKNNSVPNSWLNEKYSISAIRYIMADVLIKIEISIPLYQYNLIYKVYEHYS